MIAKLEKSILEYGFTNPVIALKESKEIVAGHARVEASKNIGLTEVPVIYLDMTREKAIAYCIADNKIALDSDWDFEKLIALAEHIRPIELTGFTKEEMDQIFADHYKEKVGKVEPDYVPEVEPEIPFVKRGDVWICPDGDRAHRVMCGDSTDQKDLETFIGKRTIGMVFTDPPYNVNYVPEARPIGGRARSKNKLGGIMGDKGDFDVVGWLNVVEQYLRQGAFYICSGTLDAPKIQQWITKKSGREPTIIVWAKNNFSIGRRDYHRQHEFIFYSWLKSKYWSGTRTMTDLWWFDKDIIESLTEEQLRKLYTDMLEQTDVWEVSRDPVQTYKHPTQKPVALAKKALRFSSRPNDVIVDFFSGSGSTLIAAYQMGRTCYTADLDPFYVGVTLARYYTFTGIEPVRKKDGAKLTEVMK